MARARQVPRVRLLQSDRALIDRATESAGGAEAPPSVLVSPVLG
jgi:hypothetical protein